MARTSTVTTQDIINDVHRVAANHDGTVRVKNYVADGAFSLGTVRNLFGASKNDTFVKILNMDATKDAPDASTVRMLVKKFAKQMGKDGIELSADNFDKHAGISSALVAETFGSFAKGLADSGYVVGEVVEVAPRKKRSDAKNVEAEETPEVVEAEEATAEVVPVDTAEVEVEDAPKVEDADTSEDEYEIEYVYVYEDGTVAEDYDEDEEADEDEYEDEEAEDEYAEEWNEEWGEFPADEDMEFNSGIDWGEDYDEDTPVSMNDDILAALQNALG